MQEYTSPGPVAPVTGNLCDPVFDLARSHPGQVTWVRREGAGWRDVAAAEFAEEVTGVARGLVAAGIQPGDRVGLLSRNRYEWTLLDYAIWAAGAVSVPIYETSSAEQVRWCLADSGAVAVVVEGRRHADAVAAVRDRLPDLREVWVLEEEAVGHLVGAGVAVDADAVARRRAGLGPDDLATLIYTSGTTGRPKGCELTHRNFLSAITSIADDLGPLFRPGASTLLFLPLAHVFGRIVQCGVLAYGARAAHVTDTAALSRDIADFRPTFLFAVPRVFEKIFTAAQQRAQESGGGRVFDVAAATAQEWSRARERGPVPLPLRVRHAVFDRLVYRRLRDAMGGRLQYAVSGGAALGERLGHFFRGVGLEVLEGYGLTETAAAGTINLPGTARIGTVGRPLPGTTVRISDEGEVLLRGGMVFRGYRGNEAATREALDDEGFLHTGDLGRLDDGFLSITGRCKEILVTAGGKNVAPAVLEDRIRAHPLVSQCIVVGDARPFVAALVTLDADQLERWKRERGKDPAAGPAELATDPDLVATLQSAVDEANQAVSRAESVRAFRVLGTDFTEESGHLTPSLKLKRHVVTVDFAADIEAIYARR